MKKIKTLKDFKTVAQFAGATFNLAGAIAGLIDYLKNDLFNKRK